MESAPTSFPDKITEKAQLLFRLRPLGNEKDKDKTTVSANSFQNKWFKEASHENHSVTFVDKDGKKPDVYKHPDFVATDEWDNKRTYDDVIAPRIPYILDGFSLNIVAYGQTGSGKSHTMIGPQGCFDTPSSDLENVDERLGIFPRAALAILKGIQESGKKQRMTVCISESNFRYPQDLQTKQLIWMDVTKNELVGQTETPINSAEDVYKIGKVLEKERTVSSTKLNQVSSRTHAMIWLRVYTIVEPNKLRINNLKVLDLAGSERGTAGNSEMQNLEAMMINTTLTLFAKVVQSVTELKKPLQNGQDIPRHITWKEVVITRCLKESFNGLAFTQFVFCASQNPLNGGESFATTKFSKGCAKMGSTVCRPKLKDIKIMLKDKKTAIETNEKKIIKLQATARKDPQQILIYKAIIMEDTNVIKLLTEMTTE